MPQSVLDIMEQCEYHVACSDDERERRISHLHAIADWCHDLAVTVQTGIPMADSDRFLSRANQTLTRA